MSIKPISFGIQFKHKKNYEVQRHNGTVVPKDVADKIVKRNMILLGVIVSPLLSGCIFALLDKGKRPLKEIAPWLLMLSFISLPLGLMNHKFMEETKDYDPKPFYRWGGFKVVEKENKK